MDATIVNEYCVDVDVDEIVSHMEKEISKKSKDPFFYRRCVSAWLFKDGMCADFGDEHDDILDILPGKYQGGVVPFGFGSYIAMKYLGAIRLKGASGLMMMEGYIPSRCQMNAIEDTIYFLYNSKYFEHRMNYHVEFASDDYKKTRKEICRFVSKSFDITSSRGPEDLYESVKYIIEHENE